MENLQKVRIAFFDIDGTLIDMNTKKISPKMIYTLQQLKAKDIIICIATGRSPMGLPEFEGLTFDTYLTFNGAYCFNEKEKIHSNPLLPEDVQTILKNTQKMNRPISVATSGRLAANGIDADLSQYYGFAKLELRVAEDFEQVMQEEIYQIMLSCREKEYSLILENTRNAKVAAWWDRAADIIPGDGGKGAGIQKILEYYHIPKEEAIAFGDGNNDIEMFGAVGTGVAMENASDRLKAVADDFCGHVAEDGIYHYCVRHNLIDRI